MPFSALLIPSLIVFIIAENGITGDPVLDFAYRSLEQSAPFLRIAFPFVLTICCAWAGFFIVKHWRLFALGLGERPIEELKDLYRSQPFGTAFMPFLILYLSYFSAGLMFSQAIWLYDSCSPHDTLAALRSGTQCNLSETTIPYVAIAYDQFLRGLLGDFVELFFPSDTIRLRATDDILLVATGFYRMFSQTAIIVLPTSFIACVRQFLDVRTTLKGENRS